jgi:hypothetical protein
MLLKKVAPKPELDHEMYPDLFVLLKWIVNSDIDHLFKSMEHTLSQRIPIQEMTI